MLGFSADADAWLLELSVAESASANIRALDRAAGTSACTDNCMFSLVGANSAVPAVLMLMLMSSAAKTAPASALRLALAAAGAALRGIVVIGAAGT